MGCIKQEFKTKSKLNLDFFRNHECQDHNKKFKFQVHMYHIAGLVDPPSICPGHFFTIRRNIIPPVIQIVLTFFVRFENKSMILFLTVLGSCSNDYLFACSHPISNER